MGTGGQAEDSGRDGANNVIRFPRDWFGSTEDLIPIGSAADRLEQAAAAAERERTPALSADDFWGEGAGALHQAVDVPGFADEEVGQASLRDLDADDRPLTAHAPGFHRLQRPARRPRALSLRVPRLGYAPRAALVVAAMVLGALALFLVGGAGSRGGSSRVSTPAAVSVVKTQPPARPVEVNEKGLAWAGHSALRLASESYFIKTQPSHSARHGRPGSRPVKSSRKHVAATHEAAATQPETTPATEPDTTPGTEPDTTPAATSTPVTDAAATVGSAASTNKTSTRASHSSPAAVGPSGPGSAGSNCDPQCT